MEVGTFRSNTLKGVAKTLLSLYLGCYLSMQVNSFKLFPQCSADLWKGTGDNMKLDNINVLFGKVRKRSQPADNCIPTPHSIRIS